MRHVVDITLVCVFVAAQPVQPFRASRYGAARLNGRRADDVSISCQRHHHHHHLGAVYFCKNYINITLKHIHQLDTERRREAVTAADEKHINMQMQTYTLQ